MEKKERKKKKGSKVAADLDWWVPPCVFNYQNVIGKKVMEPENT